MRHANLIHAAATVFNLTRSLYYARVSGDEDRIVNIERDLEDAGRTLQGAYDTGHGAGRDALAPILRVCGIDHPGEGHPVACAVVRATDPLVTAQDQYAAMADARDVWDRWSPATRAAWMPLTDLCWLF